MPLDHKKRVLVVHYSQTGQLSRLVSSVVAPLREAPGIEVKFVNLETKNAYPFPWSFFSFFDVFPEAVYLDPPELKNIGLREDEKFDLILLAYQVWFLAPSLPVTAFLKSEIAEKVLRDTPVVTLIGCRNMWAMAQETVKQLLAACGAKLVDNVVLVDQGSNLASFVTTPRWLLTGKKDAFWWFPPAGIADEQIAEASRFGLAMREGLAADKEKTGLPMLSGLRAVTADVGLIKSEKTGYRSFRIWGRLIRMFGAPGDPKRKPVLLIYVVFLLVLIITVVPVNMAIKRLLASRFREKHQAMKEYYELPSGSGEERMDEFQCQN